MQNKYFLIWKVTGRKDQKLVRKYEGPIEILKKVDTTSYQITLSTWMKIRNLKPYHSDLDYVSCNVATRPRIDLKQKDNK